MTKAVLDEPSDHRLAILNPNTLFTSHLLMRDQLPKLHRVHPRLREIVASCVFFCSEAVDLIPLNPDSQHLSQELTSQVLRNLKVLVQHWASHQSPTGTRFRQNTHTTHHTTHSPCARACARAPMNSSAQPGSSRADQKEGKQQARNKQRGGAAGACRGRSFQDRATSLVPPLGGGVSLPPGRVFREGSRAQAERWGQGTRAPAPAQKDAAFRAGPGGWTAQPPGGAAAGGLRRRKSARSSSTQWPPGPLRGARGSRAEAQDCAPLSARPGSPPCVASRPAPFVQILHFACSFSAPFCSSPPRHWVLIVGGSSCPAGFLTLCIPESTFQVGLKKKKQRLMLLERINGSYFSNLPPPPHTDCYTHAWKRSKSIQRWAKLSTRWSEYPCSENAHIHPLVPVTGTGTKTSVFWPPCATRLLPQVASCAL